MRVAPSRMALPAAMVGCLTWACGPTRRPSTAQSVTDPLQLHLNETPGPMQGAGGQAGEGRAGSREQDDPSTARVLTQRVLGEIVYFDFDRSDLTDATRHDLDAKLRILAGDRSTRIRIEGHADARGAAGYNLALGRRRAMASPFRW